MRTYWIIEHRSRGVYVGNKNGKPHFRWSILRSTGMKFYSEEDAKKTLDKIGVKGSYISPMQRK